MTSKYTRTTHVKTISNAADLLNDSLQNFSNIEALLKQNGLETSTVKNLNTNLLAAFMGEVILRSHAVEVGLKEILEISGKKPKRTHNLERLFKDLPKDAQERLSENFKDKSQQEISRVVKDCSSVFVEWRYAFENEDALNLNREEFQILEKAIQEEISFVSKKKKNSLSSRSNLGQNPPDRRKTETV